MNNPTEINKIFLNSLGKDELKQFQEIEKQQAHIGKERYGLIPQKNTFQLRDDDVLQLSITMAEICLKKETDGLHISTENQTPATVLAPETEDLVKAILSQLNSAQTFAQLISILGGRWDRSLIQDTCEQLLGTCIDIPDTLIALENQLPLKGLLRFPLHSPYKVPRTYWENSIALRHMLPLLYEAVSHKDKFLDVIAGLHRIATLGETGRNIYGGSGGIPTEPGSYRREAVVTTITRWHVKTLEWWLRFLNVPAKLIKEGEIKSLAKRPMVSLKKDGLLCMHVYENDSGSLFKLLDEARENLSNSLRFANKGNNDLMLGYLARFTQLFAIAHPFSNINASIAMNIVNDILEKQRLGRLPHLYFDYMAQRTKPSDFSLFFKAALQKHLITNADCLQHNRDGEANMRRLFDAASMYLEEEKIAFETQKAKR